MAIGQLIVPKGNVGPGIGAVVATGALTFIVVWRCIHVMARLAIRWQASVVDGTPIVGRMAIGALSTQVSARAWVARFAVGVGCVIKSDVSPVVTDVAARALSGPVADRWFVAR